MRALVIATEHPVATERLMATARLADRTITVELALTAQERQIGLMHRTALAEDAGMLFVFPHPQRLSFWMKDTQLPLAIAYLNQEGGILNIAAMEPLSLASVWSEEGAQYALEVNDGYFRRHNIVLDDALTLEDCPTRGRLLRLAPQRVVAAVLRLCR